MLALLLKPPISVRREAGGFLVDMTGSGRTNYNPVEIKNPRGAGLFQPRAGSPINCGKGFLAHVEYYF